MKIETVLKDVNDDDIKNGEFVIPNSVTTIGANAFTYCDSLTSVTLPDSVTTIDYAAFEECDSLTSITIPDSVTTIGIHAFWGCIGLTSVTLPDSVTSIGGWAFANCFGLTSITIPDGVTTIGSGTFFNCSSLTSITIPDSVTTISNSAFTGCSGLTKNSNKYYKAFNLDLTCRGFQYKENKWFKAEGEIHLCVNGFHACSNPFDLFNYYSGELNKDLVIYEVELEGISEERQEDSKVVAKRIRLVKKINSYAELLN